MGVSPDRSRRQPVERESSWSSTGSIQVLEEFDEPCFPEEKYSARVLEVRKESPPSPKPVPLQSPRIEYLTKEEKALLSSPPMGSYNDADSAAAKPSLGDKLCCIMQSFSTFAGFFSLIQGQSTLMKYIFVEEFGIQMQMSMAIGQFLITSLTFALGRRINPVYTASRGMVVMFLTSLWFIFLFAYGSGNDFLYYSTLVVAFILQSFVGLCAAAQFGAAASIHPDLAPAVAFGLSIAAISIFVLTLTARTVLGSEFTPFALIFTFTAMFQMAAVVCFNNLITKPWVVLNLERARRENKAALQAKARKGNRTGELETYSSRYDILRRCAVPVTTCFLVMVGLFSIYPTTIIKLLPTVQGSETMILGFQDLGEFFGRLMPMFSLFLPRWILLPMSLARFGLIPAVRWMLSQWEHTGIHTLHFVYLFQLIQGFNFGWILSTCMHEAPRWLIARGDREQSAVFATVATNFGISCGSALQNLLTYLDYFPAARSLVSQA